MATTTQMSSQQVVSERINTDKFNTNNYVTLLLPEVHLIFRCLHNYMFSKKEGANMRDLLEEYVEYKGYPSTSFSRSDWDEFKVFKAGHAYSEQKRLERQHEVNGKLTAICTLITCYEKMIDNELKGEVIEVAKSVVNNLAKREVYNIVTDPT